MHSQPLNPTTALAPLPPPDCAAAAAATAPEINLDLGIGRSGHGDNDNNDDNVKRDGRRSFGEAKKKEPSFSALQFHQFFNQILVYNWIARGLPALPFALFFPTCFMNPQNCDQPAKMDFEPGRCRRTDGRKWRCGRSVVPGQKYCERHVHRGRQGSRKHVEPTPTPTPTTQRVAKSNHNNCPPNDSPMPPPPPEIAPATITIDNKCDVSNKRDSNPDAAVQCRTNGIPVIDEKRHDDTILSLEIKTTNNDNGSGNRALKSSVNLGNNGSDDYTDGEKSGLGNVNPAKSSRRKQSVARNSYHGFVAPVFGLSPKSVLQPGAGKVGLNLDSKVAETEQLQRCRRTDGKKWQCRRDTIPGQKYCESHMHRGAKRIMLNPESARGVSGSNARRHTGDHINLNTTPASPQCTTANNSASSSDATTVTDEHVSFCLKQQKG
ncbi:growth-regulating factor 9-like isoform X2 [Andrographis paniculata]|uniref:growth-regulating factor 9-like isoform X2 n=1 Tax=Andrographis paniculata TaxID=175694 RepID=UPI0021E766FD|nr:growth-regulating factor 9-like isoform X2 [Andrographis paniculata]